MSTYEISKSSLLSLKAEILRKQQELVKAKADNEVKRKIIKKKTPLEIKNKGIEARQNNDISEEDADLLKQSRSMLEAKSKLYDKLSSGKLSKEEKEYNKRYLVRFDKKNRSDSNDLPPSDDDVSDEYPEEEEDRYYSDEDDTNKDPGNIWVDYVDCLGRTRKCLQKDLEYLKSKDEELKKTVEAKKKSEPNNDATPEKDANNEKENIDIEKDEEHKDKNIFAQESEMISGDMRRELLRQQWEKEEEELRNKSNIHYQDILFGEARTHGVGYYGFSKDEEERAKQQEALNKLRGETEHKQKRAQELKAMREKQLAARIKAAKNRKRARLGLPPEEEESLPAPEPEIPEEEKKKLEESKRAEEEKEKLLEEARKRYLRPWDIGKEGVKQHYEMSQEEWVEKKREERPDEFAPPSAYRKEFRSVVKTSEIEDTDKSLNFTTKKSIRKNQTKRKNLQHKKNLNPYKSSLNPYKKSKDYEEINENKFYYEDKKGSFSNIPNNTDFEEINQSAAMEPTSIINLCGETDFDDRLLADYSEVMKNVQATNTNDIHSGESSKSKDNRNIGRGVKIKPTSTIHLCEETDFDDRLLADYSKVMENVQTTDTNNLYSEESSESEDDRNRGRGVEIAPPSTFDYFGPSQSKIPRNTPKTTNIHESIEAGLKFLRKQVEEKEKSTKHPREMYLS